MALNERRRVIWIFVSSFLCLLGSYLAAVAAYRTEAPLPVEMEGDLRASLPCTAERWRPVTGVHVLDRAVPGHVLLRVSPQIGGVQIVVRCIDQQVESMGCGGDLEAYAVHLEELRKSTSEGGLVFCFFRSDNSQSWRREASFARYPGCRQWLRFCAPGLFSTQYLIGDRFVKAAGHCYQVSSYAPTVLYHRYYELDVKYILASIKFPGE